MRNGIRIGLCVLLLLLISASAGEKWESFMLRDCCQQIFSVSSELDAPKDQTKPGKYGVQNLLDGNPATCWAEGERDSGIGQDVKVALRAIPDKIKIVNGYGESPALFSKNNRIKSMTLSCYSAFSIEGHATELAMEFEALEFPVKQIVTLADHMEKQGIPFPFKENEIRNFLKKTETVFFQKHKNLTPENVQQLLVIPCKIQSVYRGTQWNDTCLSELSFHIPRRHNDKTISAIKTNKLENTVFLKHRDGTKNILVKDIDSIFQVIETSPDKAWVILIQMPASPGPGRISTRYLLYNTKSKKKVLPSPAHPDIGDLYGFETQNNTLSLQYEDLKTGNVLLLKLDEIQKKPSKDKLRLSKER